MKQIPDAYLSHLASVGVEDYLVDSENKNDSIVTLGALIPDMNAKLGVTPSHGEQYEIVSRVAYLIGVPKRIFENDVEPPKLEIYQKLDKDKRARIIRNLCILRTRMEINFLKICQGIQREAKSIIGMPEYMPIDVMEQLRDDGIDIYKNLKEPSPFLFNINQNIKNRINNCSSLFPSWLNWSYLSDLFIMPNGLTEEGTKKAAEEFYTNYQFYPYQVLS